jgi:hypothetical protein
MSNAFLKESELVHGGGGRDGNKGSGTDRQR